LATLAAELAELLNRSPLRETSSFRQWRDVAARASPPTAASAAFQELADLAHQAERARPTSLKVKQLFNLDAPR
jgi:hypothetical protein